MGKLRKDQSKIMKPGQSKCAHSEGGRVKRRVKLRQVERGQVKEAK